MTEVSEKQQPGGSRGAILTAEQAAQLIMKDSTRVRQLSKEGWIPRAKRESWEPHGYHLLDVVQGYIRFRDDVDRRKSVASQTSRVADARAREIELRNAIRERKLIDLEDAMETVTQMMGTLRTELSGVPARCTRDLQLRRTIEAVINDTLSRIADIADKIASDVEGARENSETIEGPHPGSMGGEASDPSADGGRPGAA